METQHNKFSTLYFRTLHTEHNNFFSVEVADLVLQEVDKSSIDIIITVRMATTELLQLYTEGV